MNTRSISIPMIKHFSIIILSTFFAIVMSGQIIPCENQIRGAACNNGPTPEDGSGVHGLSYSNSVCGLNYVQASLMTTPRYAPSPGLGFPATLNITGLPCGGAVTIVQAYVWWGSSNTSTDPSFTFNSVPMVGTLIGTGPEKCWGYDGTENYRGDVTAAITGNGAYTFSSPIGDGVDGATLMIIYIDPTASYQGTIEIMDGNISNNSGSASDESFTALNVCANSTYGETFSIVGDMQDDLAPPTHTVTMNGTPTVFSNDFWNFDVANTSFTAGQNICDFNMASDGGGDCYDWVLIGVYYQTTTCVACVSPGCGVLPIELVSFTGESKNSKNELKWTTSAEINNDYFTIEKSSYAVDWNILGAVDGAGNSNNLTNYLYIDPDPLPITYYRLKQTDFNGKLWYSQIISLKEQSENGIVMYPNPFEDSFTLEFSSTMNYPLEIVIYDFLGRSVYKKPILKEIDIVEIELGDQFPTGTYFVKVHNETEQYIEKLIRSK